MGLCERGREREIMSVCAREQDRNREREGYREKMR